MIPSISVLLRTRNAGHSLAALLDRIRSQTLQPAEILVVDSGSTDATPGLGREAGARVVPLDPTRFTHAVSTNLGFREATSEIVVMISQDALPADAGWLQALVRPLAEPGVAAAFGRHIPLDGCFPLERWEIERSYPAAAPAGVLYSNVNSAAWKRAWAEQPFDETVLIAEDRFWARKLMEAGRRIVYVPEAAVFHSHSYSIGEAYLRCRDEARARRRAEGVREGPGLVFKAWPRQTIRDLKRLRVEGQAGLWPRAALYRLAQFAGMAAGGR